jgi:hypothetical protein
MAVRDHLDLFETVPDSALDAMVEAAADPESPLAFAELRHWGGAMARPSPDAGPVGQPERVDAAMDRLVARLRPGASGGSFLNFLSDPARTETAYTARNYRRLAGLKRVWDLDNFFHLNHNIPPG